MPTRGDAKPGGDVYRVRERRRERPSKLRFRRRGAPRRRLPLPAVRDPNPSTAEDLTSETFELALKRWPRFDPKRGSAQTWLCQLARSTALDHFRAEERRRRREERVAEPDRGAEIELPDEYGPVVRQALRTLSGAEREVIALRVVLELDSRQAARVLGISPTACTTRLNRALEKLEQKVRPRLVA